MHSRLRSVPASARNFYCCNGIKRQSVSGTTAGRSTAANLRTTNLTPSPARNDGARGFEGGRSGFPVDGVAPYGSPNRRRGGSGISAPPVLSGVRGHLLRDFFSGERRALVGDSHPWRSLERTGDELDGHGRDYYRAFP